MNQQQESKIYIIPERGLSSLFPDTEIEEDHVNESHITWTRFSRPEGTKPVTDEEESEKNEAIREQIKLGILKIKPRESADKKDEIIINDDNDEFIKNTKSNVREMILNKKDRPVTIQKQNPNDLCACKSGKKFKKCCMHKLFNKGETK